MADNASKLGVGLKEFEGLLEKANIKPISVAKETTSVDEEEEKNFKTYLRIVLPHVALVLASIAYAVIGALIFYTVEMPHELAAKSGGVERVTQARDRLVDSMWNNSRSPKVNREEWLRDAEAHFANLTDDLYKAFKKDFVKFRHVSTKLHEAAVQQEDENIWTTSSSMFFAWTTMATIGYGNIVPVTTKGRIICVFFALFGTPLAILTIGDLGKFLSETIILGYKKYKKWRDAFKAKFSKSGPGDNASLSGGEKRSTNSEGDDSEFSSIEQLLMHKAQVPVVVVFAIHLIYIALGGLLFQWLEGWDYVDAFYFCFISLTTVGFGDMVPRRHAYLVIMLVYIGVGLAVTTMCIDLVGIHYLQKIHYFGRKFKGYDLLKLLRQRRLLERRYGMAVQAADIMQMYFDAVDKSLTPSPSAPTVEAKAFLEDEQLLHQPLVVSSTTDKVSSPEWPVDNVYTFVGHETPTIEENDSFKSLSPLSTAPSYHERLKMYAQGKRMSTSSPSGPSIELMCSLHTSPSVYERVQMYQRRQQSVTSWTPSGPDISIECSIPTTPSLHEREQMYAAMCAQSWPQSPESFLYEFPAPKAPTPEFSEIAQQVRSAKRSGSCPGRCVIEISRPIVSPQTPTPYLLRVDPELTGYHILQPDGDLLDFQQEELRRSSLVLEQQIAQAAPAISSVLFSTALIEEAASLPKVEKSHSFVVEKLVRQIEPRQHRLSSIQWFPSTDSAAAQAELIDIPEEIEVFDSPGTPPSPPPRRAPRTQSLPGTETLTALIYPMTSSAEKLVGPCSAVAITPMGMSLMEEWDSYRALVDSSRRAKLSIPNINIEQPSTGHESDEEIYPPSLLSPLDMDDAMSTNVSTPMSSPAESILDFADAEMLEMAMSDSGMSTEAEMEPMPMEPAPPEPPPPKYKREGPVFYHRNIPVFSVQSRTVETEDAVQSVMHCSEECLTAEVPQMVTENYCFVVDGEKLTAADITEDINWWRPTGRPTKYYHSQDLKTFQRVNIILVKGKVISARLASSHLQHQQQRPTTAMTGRTQSLSSARQGARRSSVSTHSAPVAPEPLAVARMQSSGPASSSSSSSPAHATTAAHMHKEHLQYRQSSPQRPTSIASGPATSHMASGHGHAQAQRPVSPMPGGKFLPHSHTFHHLLHHQYHPHHDSREVPLENVYKVTRFYSFWKTCTSFHRIITLITPLTEPHRNPDYKRRMFVQYLWRNAKESDKARVAQEFDPQKPKIGFRRINFRDPLDRKRTFHL